MLSDKKILVAVCGGIAAYKSAELVRGLRDAGAQVRVVMTAAAAEFITPLTLQALSGNPVRQELFDADAESGMSHIELAKWPDAVIVAPATADCLARLASGRGDDLLGCVYLATNAPVLLAPAMNQAMWRHPATEENRSRLSRHGVVWVGPDHGGQACGDVGPGRLADPESIVAAAQELLGPRRLQSTRVLVTAGPTLEAIDAVRFVGNRSSGKMGYALAAAARDAGAEVTLISGPTALPAPAGVELLLVTDAAQMLAAAMDHAADSQVFIAAAAVSDYRPSRQVTGKIKKAADIMTLEMERTVDIVQTVSQRLPYLCVVGFAAETRNLRDYAEEKLRKKGLDMVIANDISRTDIGFDSDENEVLALWNGGERAFPKMSKQPLARALLDLVADRLLERQASQCGQQQAPRSAVREFPPRANKQA